MKLFLEKILRGHTLTRNEAEVVMEIICNASASQEQIAGFLCAIHVRGESNDELLGFISYLRKQSTFFDIKDPIVIDICGTGGDYSNQFNISTAAALLLASSGIKVAKHGGRAVSSRCGSADVLEMLGIPSQESEIAAMKTLENNRFIFLLASRFNSSFQKIQDLRQKLRVRTAFNIIGPLLNPAQVKRQVVGVYSKDLLLPVAKIIQSLGSEEAMVIHSQDGTDEFSLNAPTDVVHLKEGHIDFYTVTPASLGFTYSSFQSLKGKNPAINATIIRDVFSGVIRNQYRDAVLLNAAPGFLIAGYAKTLEEGIEIAKDCLDKGKANDFLQKISICSSEVPTLTQMTLRGS